MAHEKARSLLEAMKPYSLSQGCELCAETRELLREVWKDKAKEFLRTRYALRGIGQVEGVLSELEALEKELDGEVVKKKLLPKSKSKSKVKAKESKVNEKETEAKDS